MAASPKTLTIRMNFGGGWATDVGPAYDGGLDQNMVIQIPFLLDAKNIIYELDGGPRKKWGTTKLNSTALESGLSVRGLVDFWRMGVAGTPVQKRVIHVDTKIKADAADGTFADIKTGVSATSVPNYCVFDDIVIISDDANSAPLYYDQTTCAALGGTPPNFAFCVKHKNRAWAAGNVAFPSRLYYSALDNAQDWVGAGSGTIDIDSDDGDGITGIASHKNSLFIFKGPNRGSIHRLTGSSPTGADAFARETFVEGIGAVWQNSIFPYGDDLAFLTPDGSVHSLKVTQEFGDFRATALTAPINLHLATRTNRQYLKKAWAVSDNIRGVALISIPFDSSTVNSRTLMMDYRFNPPRWAYWDDLANICLANVIDPSDSSRSKIMSGHSDGFVRKQFSDTRSIDGDTAITYNIKTPFMNYATPYNMKVLNMLALGAATHGGTYTLSWIGNISGLEQSTQIANSSGSLLGVFLLGTSVLGSVEYTDSFVDTPTGGEFRHIQFQVTHSDNNTDAELHSITAGVTVNAYSMEN